MGLAVSVGIVAIQEVAVGVGLRRGVVTVDAYTAVGLTLCDNFAVFEKLVVCVQRVVVAYLVKCGLKP